MIVFLAGMPRSGSTFSFNIARELLERRGTLYQEPFPQLLPVIERSHRADHILLKAHTADRLTLRLAELGAIKVVCTVRKPEDAIASWIETFGFGLDEAINVMRNWLETFERLHPYALIVHYDQLNSKPLHAAWEIAQYLCSDVDVIEVRAIARKFQKRKVKKMAEDLRRDDSKVQDIGFSYHDRKTLFHRRHVSSLLSRTAQERIGSEAVAAVRTALRPYTDDNGFLLIP